MPTGADGKQATRGVKVDLGKLGVTTSEVKTGSPILANLGDLAEATAKKKAKGKSKGKVTFQDEVSKQEWEAWLAEEESKLEASQTNDKVADEVLVDDLSEEEKEELRQQQSQRQEEAAKKAAEEVSLSQQEEELFEHFKKRKETEASRGTAKPDGSHRKDSFKHTVSPEHVKHKQEALAEEASKEAKEKKLRALREAGAKFSTPTKAPEGSFQNPLTSDFPQNTSDLSTEAAQMDLDAQFAAVNNAAGSNSRWSTFGPVPGNLSKGQAFTSNFVQGPNLSTTQSNTANSTSSNTGLPEVLAELKALREQQVTKTDLANLRQELLQSTSQLLDTKLAPLQEELAALKAKHTTLAAKQAALEGELSELKQKLATTSTGTSATNFLPATLDPATKRAAFVGWPDTVGAKQRLQQMEALVTTTFSDFKPVTYLNDFKGPYNNRKLGNVSFVEFGSQDAVRDFVKAVEESGVVVETEGKQLQVKQAQTQKQRTRNWALRKAEELVKAVPGTTGVKLDWKERKVKVGEEAAFEQGKDNLGTFLGNFTNLKLP